MGCVQTRCFGRLGWPVSEIGLGTWGLSEWWGSLDEAEAIRALQRSVELGVNFIDTAYVYGDGLAEGLIARALHGSRSAVRLATKIPPKNLEWPARHDAPISEAFPEEWIVACTERSLRNLRRDAVDLQQLHVWATGWLSQAQEWLPAIERLKRQGKIRAFGISVNDHEPDSALDVVASGLIDSVQVIHNIFDQTPAQRLLPLCQQHQVAVIARVPFDEGSLAGSFTEQTVFAPHDWRAGYFQGERLRQTVERVEQVRRLVRGESRTLAQTALKFCLSHPAVSTVIPGMRRLAHVEDCCAASDGTPLGPRLLEQLGEHAWPRNFYAGAFG